MKEIIIIEDSKLHQKKIKDIISELEYKASKVFAYGEDAVDYIINKGNHPDLVIIDVILKGEVDGYQVARQITSETNIPFIFLTAHLDQIEDFEASVYLNKPFNKEELKNNIELALYKNQMQKKILKNNEERNMILDTIETQVWYLKDPVTYGRVNQAHADFLGFEKEAVENKNLKDFLSRKAAQTCNLGNQRVFKKKKKIRTEEWLKNYKGEERLLSITKNPKLDDQGEVEYVVCSAEDITEKKERESVIKELHKIAVDFKELQDEKSISKRTVELAEKLLDFNLCNFILLKDQEFISTASSNNFKEERISISEKSIAAKTYHQGESLIVDDLQNSSEAAATKEIYKSAISIPIGDFGVFQAAAAKKSAFDEGDLELAEILISHVTAALERVYSQQKISEQKNFLSTILEVQSGLVVLLDPEGKIVRFNKACERLTGYKEEEVKGQTVWELFLDENQIGEVKKVFNQLKNRDYPNKSEGYWLTKTGEKKEISWANNVILDDKGEIKYIVGTGIDISDRIEQEEKLKEQKAYFEQLFNNSPEAIVLLDNKHRVLKANKKFEVLFGFKESEIINRNIDNLILPEEYLEKGKAYTEKVKNGKKVSGESLRKNKEGKKIDVFLQGFPIELSDGQIGIYALYNDITERKKREKRIEYLSFHDEMTGLYNRRYFENELKRLDSSRKYPITIIIGDLDGLKAVNDSCGHKKGDEYIINTAGILKSTARSEDIIARIGGDEFALILPLTDYNEAAGICNRIKDNIKKFNSQNKLSKELSISLGFEVLKNSEQSLDEVFKKADDNMYLNKRGKTDE
jgi:diguanylate cyclase (GGDEF)-like protein/PAS domain S-box-containing protein